MNRVSVVKPKPCDGNPTHAPPMATFSTTVNGDPERLDLCEPCLRDRITSALDNHEHWAVATARPGALMVEVVKRLDLPPYPRHLMSDL